MNSFTLKSHDSFQSENNRKDTHTFAPRSLIFKFQQEFLKVSDICVSWTSPKNCPGDEIFKIGNGSFSVFLNI